MGVQEVFLVDSASERDPFDKEWRDPVGQQLVAQLELTTGICFL